MRLDFAGDTLTERLGIRLRKVPVPVGRAFFGMPTARGVGVAQKLGVFAQLAGGAATPEQLAGELGVQAVPLRMLLELLAGEGLLSLADGRYSLSADGRRWLDPASPTYVGTYVEHSLEYWDWWGRLEQVLTDGGESMLDHGLPSEDPSWPIYIRGQYELARLSADEVAKAISLPGDASSILDVAGGHGWFSAALCRRKPSLHATVLDLPGSVAVGREIIREAGMGDLVHHVEGNLMSSDLGGPHDAVLAFSIIHHLTTEQRDALFARIRASLRPGGTVAVLDMFRPEAGQRPVTSASVFQLFFHLTSGSDVLSEQELGAHLSGAGFELPKRTNIRSIPDYRLYTARAV